MLRVLKGKYGTDVTSGDKAIRIAANGSRRNADVIVAVQFRRYCKFNGICDQSYVEGICFYSASGERIANYPKHHSRQLTQKHQESGAWFKPMVRIMKNLRGKLVDQKLITGGLAPSYYLEGLLYNVPGAKFGSSYGNCFVNCITWIQEADKSKFVCANEQYYLLRDGSPVTWRASKCEEFLRAAIKLWNDW